MTNDKFDLTFGGEFNGQGVLVARIYSASKSWNALCRHLWAECEKTPNYRIATNSICALSIELSLKTILAICGHTEKCLRDSGHSLVDLMKKIGDKNYEVIKQSYEKIANKNNFEEALKANDDCFNKWKYILPEKGTTDFVDDFDYQFMRWLQEALSDLSEVAHSAFLKAERSSK